MKPKTKPFKPGDRVKVVASVKQLRRISAPVSARGLVGRVVHNDDGLLVPVIQFDNALTTNNVGFSDRWTFCNWMLKLVKERKPRRTK